MWLGDLGGAAMSYELEMAVTTAGCDGDVMVRPVLVYVSGPYTHGDRATNVLTALLAGRQIELAGHSAHVPHYGYFMDQIVAREYEAWMTVDLRMLQHCHWFLRLPGHSPGADREHERAKVLGLRIFLSLEECLAALPKGEAGG